MPRARLAMRPMTRPEPFSSSWNTGVMTRALRRFASAALKYSVDAQLTITGWGWPSRSASRRGAMRPFQKA